MAGHLKAEIQSICAEYGMRKEADGWLYRRSGPYFRQELCQGVDMFVWPSFSYIERGLMCISQPSVRLRSAMFVAELAKVFEKPLEGPVAFSLRSWKFVDGLLVPRLREYYFRRGTPYFIDIDPPEATAANGYFQTEELPDYLDLVLASALNVARHYFDFRSERDFLLSLPTRLELSSPFSGGYLGSEVAFSVIDLMRGNPSAVADLREVWDYPITADRDSYLRQLEAAADQVSTLA